MRLGSRGVVRKGGNTPDITSGSTMRFTDSDDSARLLLQVMLLEMGLSADLDELDRRVAADPAFLQELKRRAEAYLTSR